MPLTTLSRILRREQVGLDLEHDVVLALAGVLEELLVVGVLREALLLLLVEGLLDVGVGDLDALLLGLALEPLEGDQQLEHLVADLLVLLLALGLELRVGDLRLALGRLRGRLALGGDALRVVRRLRAPRRPRRLRRSDLAATWTQWS